MAITNYKIETTYDVSFKKKLVFAIYGAKWGHVKLECTTLKVLPQCLALNKRYYNIFNSMSILAKLEALKVGGQKLLGSCFNFQLKLLRLHGVWLPTLVWENFEYF